MAEFNQFGSAKPVRSGEGTSCAECEAMLMDALDGVLSAREQAAFDRHIATCAECSQMLEDAKRGATMLEVLKFYRPEPSATLVGRILAQTSGVASPAPNPVKSQHSGIIAIPGIDGAAVEIHSVVPATVGSRAVPAPGGGGVGGGGTVLPFRSRVAATFNLRAMTHTMMQPRLAMTAAMAFFSIALTLNLTGVHLNELKASDLAPSNIKRSFYHANASVVRYYDNLRVVYELESKLDELRRTDAGDSSADHSHADPQVNPTRLDPDKTPDQSKPRKAPKSGSGTSERRGIEDHRGIDDRRTPLGRQFQLAGYRESSKSSSDIARDSVLARSHDALNESLRKGDLV